MFHLRIRFTGIFIFLSFLICINGYSQGPQTAYYYNPAVNLSWAECFQYQHGGSKQKIAFLPVINRNFYRAPLGTSNYSKDIDINGPIVFIGNGIVQKEGLNSYVGRRPDYLVGNLDVKGKIVLFCYDFPDFFEEQINKDYPLEKRITEAASRGAAGVILFSMQKEFPFLYVRYQNKDRIPDISAITITKDSAIYILESGGLDAGTLLKDWKEEGKTQSAELFTSLDLRIKGSFDKVESQNFLFRFRSEQISSKEMEEIAEMNEKAIEFLFDFFKEDNKLIWNKNFTVYFRYFDSKLFYTHHWGSGLSSPEGIFNVHQGGVPNFGLTVHENTHVFTRLNWSQGTSSFMSEGIARYVEAQSTDPDINHDTIRKFISEKDLIPLKELVTHNIGQPGKKTMVGYPAAGSFVGFLIDRFGLPALKEAYILENRSAKEKEKDTTWEKVFGKSLSKLEQEWLVWL